MGHKTHLFALVIVLQLLSPLRGQSLQDNTLSLRETAKHLVGAINAGKSLIAKDFIDKYSSPNPASKKSKFVFIKKLF